MYFVFFAQKTKYKYINMYFKYKYKLHFQNVFQTQNTYMYFKYVFQIVVFKILPITDYLFLCTMLCLLFTCECIGAVTGRDTT